MGQKFVFVTDTHGDMIDPRAHDLFIRFMDDFKPKIRIHGGDIFDFRALRRNASRDEKCESMLKDIDSGLDFLNWYRPQYLLRGNHDERLWDKAKTTSGPLSDFAQDVIADSIVPALKKAKCKMLPYCKRKGVLKVGKMKFVHGFYSGDTATKRMALAYGSCLFGHIHRFSVHSVPGAHSGRRAVARAVGGLCRLDMDYNRTHVDTLAQAQGWAYGEIDSRGEYNVFQAEIIHGHVTYATQLKTIK